MASVTNNKTIAKNTAYLYVRMFITMVVALYTSRVVLDELGANDYGLYQAVGGIVGFISFINSALGAGSARFITVALGKQDKTILEKTFSTTLSIHILLACGIIILAETIGLWFLNHKMIISPDKMFEAHWVFQLSLITTFFSLTQIPYNACIIAHEKMHVYAYVSIVEVVLKLGIAFVLMMSWQHKLIVYASLLCAVSVGLQLFYRYYCTRNFNESKYSPRRYDRKIIKEIGSFSWWQLFTQGTIALNGQGMLILLNMFFQPAVVTATAIASQVNGLANQFVSNFRTAVNPQIIKRFASDDLEGSKILLLSSTKYSFFMMWILTLPLCILATPLLNLWLVDVPDYTAIFLKIALVQSLFQVFDTSFFTVLYAKGDIRQNALLSSIIGFIRFPIVYILFRYGFSPVCMSWASLVTFMLLSMVVKPWLLIKKAGYRWSDFVKVIAPCVYVVLMSLPIPVLCYVIMGNGLVDNVVIAVVSILCVVISVWIAGVDSDTRGKIISLCRAKFHKGHHEK